MLKLLNDMSFIHINDYKIYDEPFKLDDDRRTKYSYRMSPGLFLSNEDQVKKHEMILYQSFDGYTNYMLLLNKRAIKDLSSINSIKFQFSNSLPDMPIDDHSVGTVEYEIKNISDAIEKYLYYLRYSCINYLPYSDFAIDHMPTIDRVYINGQESPLFALITSYMNFELEKITNIQLYKNGKYKFSDNYDNIKTKKLYTMVVRVNSQIPLFVSFNQKDWRIFKKLDNIDITLRWYNINKGDYIERYEESDIDDYMYTGPGYDSILTLEACYRDLIKYYNHELKYIKDNHYLIIFINGHFRVSDKGIFTIQNIENCANERHSDCLFNLLLNFKNLTKYPWG